MLGARRAAETHGQDSALYSGGYYRAPARHSRVCGAGMRAFSHCILFLIPLCQRAVHVHPDADCVFRFFVSLALGFLFPLFDLIGFPPSPPLFPSTTRFSNHSILYHLAVSFCSSSDLGSCFYILTSNHYLAKVSLGPCWPPQYKTQTI